MARKSSYSMMRAAPSSLVVKVSTARAADGSSVRISPRHRARGRMCLKGARFLMGSLSLSTGLVEG